MVLRPERAAHERMLRLMNDKGSVDVWWGGRVSVKGAFVGSDPGDQSVWRSFYPRVHELPVGFNTFKKTRFAATSDWERVSILHDPDVHRGHAIPHARVEAVYRNLTLHAKLLVTALATEQGVQDRG